MILALFHEEQDEAIKMIFASDLQVNEKSWWVWNTHKAIAWSIAEYWSGLA